MSCKSLLSFLILFCSSVATIAQTTITGIVIDAKNKNALPFVNIGIASKNVGTSANPDGTFTILIPQNNLGDTLTFSMAGYATLRLPLQQIKTSGQAKFALQAKASELKPVTVSTRKLIERKYGVSGNHSLIHFTDGSTSQADIFEIAQAIERDTIPAKITSVNLFISDNRADSGTFRVNFYSYAASRPGERIIDQSIVQTHAIKEGWLKLDLSPYNIRLKGAFVVSIEFIPTTKGSIQTYYEIKPGGSSKSFVRKNSQGAWTQPPHRYRMFITALEPDSKRISSIKHKDEDEEPVPAFRFYSRTVQDSFSIFIHLPNEYGRRRHQNFPVVYLLDANVYFDAVSSATKAPGIESSILVGIGYHDFVQMDSLRIRDYTFPEALPQDSFPVSGGAARFLAFLNTELIPHIDKSYRTDTIQRTLMGHSFGGYFTLYALWQSLLSRNNAFKKYVAASPALEYDSSWLLKQFQLIPHIGTNSKQKIFLTIGGKEDAEDGGTATVVMDTYNRFHQILTELGMTEETINSEVYPEYGHMETAIPTFIKNLKLNN